MAGAPGQHLGKFFAVVCIVFVLLLAAARVERGWTNMSTSLNDWSQDPASEAIDGPLPCLDANDPAAARAPLVRAWAFVDWEQSRSQTCMACHATCGHATCDTGLQKCRCNYAAIVAVFSCGADNTDDLPTLSEALKAQRYVRDPDALLGTERQLQLDNLRLKNGYIADWQSPARSAQQAAPGSTALPLHPKFGFDHRSPNYPLVGGDLVLGAAKKTVVIDGLHIFQLDGKHTGYRMVCNLLHGRHAPWTMWIPTCSRATHAGRTRPQHGGMHSTQPSTPSQSHGAHMYISGSCQLAPTPDTSTHADVKARAEGFDRATPHRGMSREWSFPKYSKYGQQLFCAKCTFNTSIATETSAATALVTSLLSKDGPFHGLTCKTPDGATATAGSVSPAIHIEGCDDCPKVYCKYKVEGSGGGRYLPLVRHAHTTPSLAKHCTHHLTQYTRHRLTHMAPASGPVCRTITPMLTPWSYPMQLDDRLMQVGLEHIKHATSITKLRGCLENYAKLTCAQADRDGIAPSTLLNDPALSMIFSIGRICEPPADKPALRGSVGLVTPSQSMCLAIKDAGYLHLSAQIPAEPGGEPKDIYRVTIAAVENCTASHADKATMDMVLTMPKSTAAEILEVLRTVSTRMGSTGPLKLKEFSQRGIIKAVSDKDMTEHNILRFVGDQFGCSLALAKDAVLRSRSKGSNTFGDLQHLHFLIPTRQQRLAVVTAFAHDQPILAQGGYVELDTARNSDNGGLFVYMGKRGLDSDSRDVAVNALYLSELLGEVYPQSLHLPPDLDPRILGRVHCLGIMLDRPLKLLENPASMDRYLKMLNKLERLKQLAVSPTTSTPTATAGGGMAARMAARMATSTSSAYQELQQLLREVWPELQQAYAESGRCRGVSGYQPTWVEKKAGRPAFAALGPRRASDPGSGSAGGRGGGRHRGSRGRGFADRSTAAAASPGGAQQQQPSAGLSAPPPPAPPRADSRAGGRQQGPASQLAGAAPQQQRPLSRAHSLSHIPRGGSLVQPVMAQPATGSGNNQQASVLQVQNNILFDDGMAGGGDNGGADMAMEEADVAEGEQYDGASGGDNGGAADMAVDAAGAAAGVQRDGAGGGVQRSPPVHSAQRGGPRRRIEEGERRGVRLEDRLAADARQHLHGAAPASTTHNADGAGPSGGLTLPPLPNDDDEVGTTVYQPRMHYDHKTACFPCVNSTHNLQALQQPMHCGMRHWCEVKTQRSTSHPAHSSHVGTGGPVSSRAHPGSSGISPTTAAAVAAGARVVHGQGAQQQQGIAAGPNSVVYGVLNAWRLTAKTVPWIGVMAVRTLLLTVRCVIIVSLRSITAVQSVAYICYSLLMLCVVLMQFCWQAGASCIGLAWYLTDYVLPLRWVGSHVFGAQAAWLAAETCYAMLDVIHLISSVCMGAWGISWCWLVWTSKPLYTTRHNPVFRDLDGGAARAVAAHRALRSSRVRARVMVNTFAYDVNGVYCCTPVCVDDACTAWQVAARACGNGLACSATWIGAAGVIYITSSHSSAAAVYLTWCGLCFRACYEADWRERAHTLRRWTTTSLLLIHHHLTRSLSLSFSFGFYLVFLLPWRLARRAFWLLTMGACWMLGHGLNLAALSVLYPAICAARLVRLLTRCVLRLGSALHMAGWATAGAWLCVEYFIGAALCHASSWSAQTLNNVLSVPTAAGWASTSKGCNTTAPTRLYICAVGAMVISTAPRVWACALPDICSWLAAGAAVMALRMGGLVRACMGLHDAARAAHNTQLLFGTFCNQAAMCIGAVTAVLSACPGLLLDATVAMALSIMIESLAHCRTTHPDAACEQSCHCHHPTHQPHSCCHPVHACIGGSDNDTAVQGNTPYTCWYHETQPHTATSCQIHAANHIAGAPILTHTLMQLHAALQKLVQPGSMWGETGWVYAAAGGWSDDAINHYLSSYWGVSVAHVNLATVSDSTSLLQALRDLRRADSSRPNVYVCKSPLHTFIVRHYRQKWYKHDSFDHGPVPLTASTPLRPCTVHAIHACRDNTPALDHRAHLLLGRNVGYSRPARQPHSPYGERQIRQCCMVHATNAAYGDQLINPYTLMDMHRILSTTATRKRGREMRHFGNSDVGLFSPTLVNFYLSSHDRNIQLRECGRMHADADPVQQLEAALCAAPTRVRDAVILATKNAAGHGHAITLRMQAEADTGVRCWWFIDSECDQIATPLPQCTAAQRRMLQGDMYAMCRGHEAVNPTLAAADPRAVMDAQEIIELTDSPTPPRRQRTRANGATLREPDPGTDRPEHDAALTQHAAAPAHQDKPGLVQTLLHALIAPRADTAAGAPSKAAPPKSKRPTIGKRGQQSIHKFLTSSATQQHQQKQHQPQPQPAAGATSPPQPAALHHTRESASHLKMMTWNVRGAHRSQHCIRSQADEHNPDVLVLTETMGNKNAKPAWLTNALPGYSLWHTTRLAGKKGIHGVLVAVKEHIAMQGMALPVQPPSYCPKGRLQSVLLQLTNPDGAPRCLLLLGTYWPAGADPDAMQERQAMEDSIACILQAHADTQVVMLGDMNAAAFAGDREPGMSYSNDKAYQGFIQQHSLTPFPESHPRARTYQGTSRIDDILVGPGAHTSEAQVRVVTTGAHSDHSPVLLTAPASCLGLSWPASPPAPPRSGCVTVCLPITKADKAKFVAAVTDPASGIPEAAHDLANKLRPAAGAARAFFTSLQGRCSSGRVRMQDIQGKRPQQWLDETADQLNTLMQKFAGVMKSTCASKQVIHGGRHFRPRMISKLRTKLTRTLQAARLLLHDRLEELAVAVTSPLSHTVHALRQQLQGGEAEHGEQLSQIVKDTRAEIKKIDDEHNAAARQAAKERMRATLDTKPKQAHKAIFKKGGIRSSLSALKHPDTGQTVTDTTGLLHAAWTFFTNMLKAPGPKTGKYLPNERTCAAFPFANQVAVDHFKLQTAATKLAKRPWLHASITDTAAFLQMVSQLGNKKAPGPDGVINEMIKMLPSEVLSAIHDMFIVMWATGTTPTTWKQSDTILLSKLQEENPAAMIDLVNYRPIGLANALYKLWTKTVTQALSEYAEEHSILSSMQAGFRKQKATIDQLQQLVHVLEDARLHKQDAYCLVVDLKAAFNSTDQDKLLYIMHSLGFGTDAIEVVRGLYTGATTRIRLPACRTDPVSVDRGTVQGDSLSPFLFLVYLEPLLRWLHAGGRGYKHGALSDAPLIERLRHAVSSLAYADDLNIMTGGPAGWSDMHVQANKLTDYANWGSLQVSHKKTKITGVLYGSAGKGLVKSPTDAAFRLNGKLQVQGAPVSYLPPTKPFSYLGVLFTMVLDWRPQKCAMTKTLKEKLTHLRASYATPRQAMHMLKTVIKPSVAYSFPVVPCSPDELDTWDRMIASAARQAYGLMRSSPTAMVREDVALGGMGCTSLAVEYATRNIQSLVRSLWDEGGRMGAVTSALLDQQLDLLSWVAKTQGCVQAASRFCMRARQMLLTHTSGLRVMRNNTSPYQQQLDEISTHLAHGPTAISRAVRHLLAAGITNWDQLLDSTGTQVVDGATLRRTFGSRRVRKLQVAALNRLAALLNLDHEPSVEEEQTIMNGMSTDMHLPASRRTIKRVSTLEALCAVRPGAAWLKDNHPTPKQGKIPDWFHGPTKPRAAQAAPQRPAPPTHMEHEGRRTATSTVRRILPRGKCTASDLWTWKQNQAHTHARRRGWCARAVCDAMFSHRWLPAKVLGVQYVKGQRQYIVQWWDNALEPWAVDLHHDAGLDCQVVPDQAVHRADRRMDECDCEMCFEPTCLASHRCGCCHRTFHAHCLLQHGLVQAAPTDQWTCPSCTAADDQERTARGDSTLVTVRWATTAESADTFSNVPGAQDLINAYEAEQKSPQTTLPHALDAGMDDMDRQGGARATPWYSTLGKTIREKFCFHTQTVNPQLDIEPTGAHVLALHPVEGCAPAPPCMPTTRPGPPATKVETVASVWGPDGKHVGSLDVERMCILKRLSALAKAPDRLVTQVGSFAENVCALLLRARAGKRTLHTMPGAMVQAIRSYFPMFNTELYSSPLTVHPDTQHYWSEVPADAAFGAGLGSRARKHLGFALAVPEHTDESMCAAVKHAVLSAAVATDAACATLLLLRHRTSAGYHTWGQTFSHLCTHIAYIKPNVMPLWVHKPGCVPGHMYPTYTMQLLLVWNDVAKQQVAAAAAARTDGTDHPDCLTHAIMDACEQLANELQHLMPAPGARITWQRWHKHTAGPRLRTTAGEEQGSQRTTYTCGRAPATAPHIPFKFRELPDGAPSPSLPPMRHTWQQWCAHAAVAQMLSEWESSMQNLTLKYPSWRSWAYTDGSKLRTEEGSAIGAAVYVPASQSLTTICPEASGLTNTINNAEVAGVHTAAAMKHMNIATDSSCTLYQVRKFVYNPMTMLMHTHRQLLQRIVDVGAACIGTIHIYKVKAHSGVIGNEGADAGAKWAATHPHECDVQVQTPDNPFEHEFWLYQCNADEILRPLHDLGTTLRTHLHNLYKLGKANIESEYYRYWQKVWSKAGHQGMCKPSNSFMTDASIPHAAKRCVMQYRQGVLWNGKLAMRCGKAATSACPLCGAPDSGHHILAGPCPKLANMVTERHNEAGRRICKAISQGAMGKHMVSMDVGSTQKLQEAGVALALPRQAPAWLMSPADWNTVKAANDGKASVPDAVLVMHKDHATGTPWDPNRDSPAAAEVRLVEIKYCRDTQPEDQLARATKQHHALMAHLRSKGFSSVSLHTILLGVGGTVYTGYTQQPLLDLGVSRPACTSLLSKLHKHAVVSAGMLVSARRTHERAVGWYG